MNAREPQPCPAGNQSSIVYTTLPSVWTMPYDLQAFLSLCSSASPTIQPWMREAPKRTGLVLPEEDVVGMWTFAGHTTQDDLSSWFAAEIFPSPESGFLIFSRVGKAGRTQQIVGRETLKDKKDNGRRDQEEVRVMRCSPGDLNESPLTEGGHMCIL